MTTPQFKTRANSVQRAAFTLVELMVVILIIGILTAIATPFIFGALTTTREFTITNEVQQMNAAVDRFKTKHGFYPPSLNTGSVDTVGEFRQFLNRIAPNHAEGTGSDGGGLDLWWQNVGSKLDQRSSLVFWLSGLCTSKQYPLSGNSTLGVVLAPYSANKNFNDVDLASGVSIDRDVFYDFKSGQLVSLEDSSGTALSLGIKGFNQPYGKGDDIAYLYRDFKSYVSASGNAYFSGFDGNGDPNFLNPTSCQIIGPGLDGVVTAEATPVTDLSDSTQVDPAQDDNITNFSNGRLQKSYDE